MDDTPPLPGGAPPPPQWPPPPSQYAAPPPGYAGPDNTLGGLIPVRNSQALIAYYLGVFSLIPCLGIPLGVAAVVLGLRGLAFANASPEAKGKTHARVGVIVGGLCALANIVAAIALAAMSHVSR